jgi:hypothetical protein
MANEWKCAVCHKPIAWGDGLVKVFNVDKDLGPVGAYPRKATEGRYTDTAGGEEQRRARSLLEMSETVKPVPPNVGFEAYHTECDPSPGRSAYEITVKRAATLDQWCSWVLHLGDKKWMGREDILRMLAYYFDNRGIEYGALT